jgi:ferredoxin/flavodoxin---NADP+ reductase
MAGPRPRVAIVGAGPAGAFAAACLLRAHPEVEIDLFDRLPTPWGLLRAGVAPDHQEIKRLGDTFDRETFARGCRFLGNVEIGVDVSHAELLRHYTAVVYATGAQTDKSLGIPGEGLAGSWAATEFVAWYNGHPEYRELRFDLSGPRAVVIGNGNVAADVSRMLTLSARELERTDVADHALEALRASGIEEVIVLGRRGPAQAAFTSAELRELGHLEGVELRVRREEIELDPVSRRWLAEEGTFTARKNVELLREFAAAGPRAGARRRIELRFLRSPVAIRGTNNVEAIDLRRNQIVRGGDGLIRATPVDEGAETIECGLVLRSVGYRAVPLPDVPFDERYFVLPNERGRVFALDGVPLPGVYAVGWIKRGPTGILGTNKRDAEETISCLVEDLRAGALPSPPSPEREQLDALLTTLDPVLVTVEGWRRIDAHELAGGRAEQRPRVKLASREELLAAAHDGVRPPGYGLGAGPRFGSVRVLVLAPRARLRGLGLRRAVEQEAVIRGDERVGRHHGVGVVDRPVLARERDPAGALAQAVLELRPDLARPFLEPARRVVDHLLHLGNLLCLLLGQREAEIEGEVAVVGGDVGKLPTHPLLVGRQPLDRCPREAEQCHVAVVHVDELAVEPVTQVGAAGTGTHLVVWAEHDVVREEL